MTKTGSFLAILFFTNITHAITIKPFSLPEMNGEQQGLNYNSSDHKTAVFVIENYFLNCHYCNDNAPNVNALAEEFLDNKRVQVLDVGVDRNASDYEEWIRRHEPNHPVLNDYKKSLTGQLGTFGYPSTYVLDCNGSVALRTSGVWSSEMQTKIKNKVKALLRRPCKRVVRD